MKESRKQFIKDGHAAACSEWKAKIEKEFPKLFKKTELVVGKWYKYKVINSLLYSTDVSSHFYISAYGVYKDVWHNEGDDRFSKKKLIPATDKEVKEALIKEAKKRGFKKGVKVVSPYNSNHTRVIASSFRLERGSLVSTSESGRRTYLFFGGKWATIIESITKEEAEKQLGKTIID